MFPLARVAFYTPNAFLKFVSRGSLLLILLVDVLGPSYGVTMEENYLDGFERRMKAQVEIKAGRDRVTDAGLLCGAMGIAFPFIPQSIAATVCALAFGIVAVCRDRFAKGMCVIFFALFCSFVGYAFFIHTVDKESKKLRDALDRIIPSKLK